MVEVCPQHKCLIQPCCEGRQHVHPASARATWHIVATLLQMAVNNLALWQPCLHERQLQPLACGAQTRALWLQRLAG